MLVPELLDIAEQLKITAAKKLNKQELVYKILDKQATIPSDKAESADDKPKRKRIVKATTGNSSEEAYVESGDTVKTPEVKPKKQQKPAPKVTAKAEPKEEVIPEPKVEVKKEEKTIVRKHLK